MFEEHMIQTDSLENICENGKITGFRFRIRLASDRGLWLSLIGGFYVAVDGAPAISQEQLTLSIIDGPSHPVTELSSCVTERWDHTKAAWLSVRTPGGLAPGAHEIAFEEVLLGGYFKAREEWVTNPPLPGASGKITIFHCNLKKEEKEQ